VREGDLLPEIAATLTDADGNAVPLPSGTTVRFRMYTTPASPTSSPTFKVDQPAVITDAVNGRVSYAWSGTDTNTSGEYFAHWYVTFPDTRKETFPNRDSLVVEVMEPGDLGYTYSGDPTNSEVDQVRFLIGDIGPTDWLLSDDEIRFLLTLDDDPVIVAAMAAEGIGSRYAGKGSKTVGDLSIDFTQKAKGYYDLAAALRDRANSAQTNPPMAYAGGWNLLDKESHAEDGSQYFKVGMHDSEFVDPLLSPRW
jgi:hypothetical protein